jgi:hypothetical protein
MTDGYRRTRSGRLLATIAVIGLGVAAVATPAGAVGLGHVMGRAVHGTLSPGVRERTSRGLAPLTEFTGTTYVSPADGSATVTDIAPRVTDLTAVGNTTDDGYAATAAIQGALPGAPSGVSVYIGIDTPGNAALQAGRVYSSSAGATFHVSIPVTADFEEGCSPGIDPNSEGAIEVDQVSYAGATPTVLAFQFDFVCDFGGAGGISEFVGTAAVDITPTTPGQGYYLYGSDGGLAGFGNDSYLSYLGDLTQVSLNSPIVGMATTTDGAGYWMTAADGGVFAYGDARFYGSTGNLILDQPVVGMAATPDDRGYWFVAADGGVFSYGDARFYGSMGGSPLNEPIVGMAATTDGRGYWLVAADGGVFAYGDARFYGSTGNIHLVQPVVGMTPTPDGRGYWFVAADGGVFAYGDARFYGSIGGRTLARPVVGMTTAPDGRGYWIDASDGGVFAFGSAHFAGSAGGEGVTDVVGMTR